MDTSPPPHPVFLEMLSLLHCPGEAFPSEQDGCCPAGPFFVCATLGIGLDTAQQRALAASPAQEPEYDISDSFWVLYLVLSESWPTHSARTVWDMP